MKAPPLPVVAWLQRVTQILKNSRAGLAVRAGLGVVAFATLAQAGEGGGDTWVTNAPPQAYPSPFSADLIAPPDFAPAGGVSRRGLSVLWSGTVAEAHSNPPPVLVFSWGKTDRWTARDWRRIALHRDANPGGGWRTWIPVPTAEVPAAYFLAYVKEGTTNVSPLRCFDPKEAGMAEATFPFRGFVEGFEDGIEGWELASSGGVPDTLAWSTNALSGRRALRVRVPEGRGSVTVGTVRLRGWMLREYDPSDLRIAMRTTGGEGRIQVALHSRAHTQNLAVHPAHGEVPVGETWQRLEVPLKAFVHLRPEDVDWLTIQFLAEPGRELLLDDVELVLR